MTNNLETKIEENLPAIRQEDELAKLANEASALEIGIVSFLDFYMTSISILNFGLLSVSAKQWKRIENNSTFEKSKSFAKYKAEVVGAHLGIYPYLLTECAFGLWLYSLFGGPIGAGAYLSTKAITNYLGYKYYKNQRKKHERLDKIYLLEKNDK